MKNIVFTGGGTGGHIMPNLAIIDELKGYKIYYFGTNGLEKDILKNYPQVQFVEIEAVKLIRSLTPKNFIIPFKLINSIKSTKEKLKKINPCLIFSKGGFVSFPTCFAGNQLKIPVITHESDLTVGLANKIISKKAKYLCCSFRETANKYKNGIHTGSPIRRKIFNGNKEIILNRHKLDNNKQTILIMGGSLGAQTINKIIWDNLDPLLKKYNIIHIVGKNKLNKNISDLKNYIQLEFANDIENYFNASDLVISRAGSNTIFELLALSKPMILIPLSKKSSRGDQILNAKNFEKKNFAKMILEENLNSNLLLNTIEDVIANKNKYIAHMRNFKNSNGTLEIIKLIEKTIV